MDPGPPLREIHHRIIRALRSSARASAQDIARGIGADYRVVRRELARLLDSGTVRITATADPALTGRRIVAYVWLKSRSLQNGFVQHLAAAPEVMWGAVTMDHARAIGQISCESAADFLRLLDEFRTWPEVVDLDAALVLRSYIGPQVASTSPELRNGATTAGMLWLGGEVHATLDGTDRRILDLLRLDGRVPLTDIAEALEIPLTTARRRLTRLLDLDGVSLQCRVKPAALGYALHAGVRMRVSEDAAGFARAFATLNPVAWLSEMSGPYPVMAELMTATQTEMDVAIRAIVSDARCRDIEVVYYDGESVKDTGFW